MHPGPFGCLTKLVPKRAELVQKFVPRSRVGTFTTNAPDPRHWTLNSWFGAFPTVCVHLGPFHRLMKLGSKRAELVQLRQKFVPRSRFIAFGNECNRSSPLDPKLMFWHISDCLGALETVSSPYETRLKTGRTGTIKAKVRATKPLQNFSQRTNQIDPIGP